MSKERSAGKSSKFKREAFPDRECTTENAQFCLVEAQAKWTSRRPCSYGLTEYQQSTRVMVKPLQTHR